MIRLCLLLAVFALTACSAGPAKEQLHILGKKGKPLATFQVEVAKTDDARSKGLMHRTRLPDTDGMLFVFDAEQQGAFWMKNTLIPLDMIFIARDGRIESIHRMAEPNSRKIIKSKGNVVAGLEINGGMAKKLGIKPGQKVTSRSLPIQLDKP